jgi:hypothetical protein
MSRDDATNRSLSSQTTHPLDNQHTFEAKMSNTKGSGKKKEKLLMKAVGEMQWKQQRTRRWLYGRSRLKPVNTYSFEEDKTQRYRAERARSTIQLPS